MSALDEIDARLTDLRARIAELESLRAALVALGISKHQLYRTLQHVWFARVQGLWMLTPAAPVELRSAARSGRGAASPST